MKTTYVVCENRYLDGEFVWCNIWGTTDSLETAVKALKAGISEMENLYAGREILKKKLNEGAKSEDCRFEIEFDGKELFRVNIIETKEL